MCFGPTWHGIIGDPSYYAFLRGVTLEVPPGSVVALLGSNGGGKTTTLNAIAGLIPMHSGSITFRGEEIGGHSAFVIVRKGLALSPEGWRLFVQQSVENNLLLGATPLADKTRKAGLLERVYEIFPRLKERRNQRAGTMSGGERQMLAVGLHSGSRQRWWNRCTRRSAGCTGRG